MSSGFCNEVFIGSLSLTQSAVLLLAMLLPVPVVILVTGSPLDVEEVGCENRGGS